MVVSYQTFQSAWNNNEEEILRTITLSDLESYSDVERRAIPIDFYLTKLRHFEDQERNALNQQQQNNHARNEIIKVASIKAYKGEAKGLERFLSQVLLWCRGRNYDTDQAKIIAACSALEGRAYEWYESKLCEEPDYVELTTWDQFLDEIRRDLGEYEPEERARDKLKTLKQTGSCSTYVVDFNNLRYKSRLDATALKDAFHTGLKPEVKDAISMSVIDPPGDLSAYQRFAQRIDDRIYKRKMEKRGKTKSPIPSSSPDAMDIDKAQLSLEEKKKRKDYRLKNNLCLYCGGEHKLDSCSKLMEKNEKK
eukprot:Pgem_evm2s1910